MIARVPLGRMGTPEDIADLALFLVSDHSSYITGQAIDICGGWGLVHG
jgi:NAD(P)-dependent dehydrogenase (short-subunit alcohol dehydrogenase family)